MNLNDIEFENGSMDELLGTPDNTETTEPTQPQEEIEVPDFTETVEDPMSTQEDTTEEPPVESDIMTSFLKEYGIEDGIIMYENDNGETEQVNFNELDSAEQLNILKELVNPGLSEEEIKTINFLRTNNATFQDAIEFYSKKAVQDYIDANGPVQKEYAIDDYSDEELYFADLKRKYPEMSDEEIQSDVDSAKENEELFKKKADAIRKQYKALEDEKVKEAENARKQQYEQFTQSIVDSVSQFNSISLDYKDKEADSLIIDNDMKNNIYHYLVNPDENGESQFAKDLRDPNNWVMMAAYRLYGNEIISNITNYWKNELKNTRREQKPVKQSQTTVKKADNKTQKMTNYHQGFDFVGGENLL